jgi:hypothetical protein
LGLASAVTRDVGHQPRRGVRAMARRIRAQAQVNLHLIWVTIHANMGSHIMKTTIEIADDLFERAQRLVRKEKTTFRALTEQGLRLVLKEKQSKTAPWKWKPLVVTKGGGLTDEFKNASWEKIRDEIYRGRGA